jgi:hypothetical protein
MFGNGNSRTLFRPLADQPTDLAVQLHLRHTRRHSGIYGGEKVAVVNGFSDIHWILSFLAIYALIFSKRTVH